jgi:hypothetical protein
MGLKKGRKIIVRELNFVWKFKAHRDNLTRFGQSSKRAHVAVHLEEGAGKMVAYIESTREVPGDSELQNGAEHKARFGPGDVRTLIEAAMDEGWDPTSRRQYNLGAGIVLTDHVSYDRVTP